MWGTLLGYLCTRGKTEHEGNKVPLYQKKKVLWPESSIFLHRAEVWGSMSFPESRLRGDRMQRFAKEPSQDPPCRGKKEIGAGREAGLQCNHKGHSDLQSQSKRAGWTFSPLTLQSLPASCTQGEAGPQTGGSCGLRAAGGGGICKALCKMCVNYFSRITHTKCQSQTLALHNMVRNIQQLTGLS